jgi:hypothetical protein
MLMTGCDYHPSSQQIAFADTVLNETIALQKAKVLEGIAAG